MPPSYGIAGAGELSPRVQYLTCTRVSDAALVDPVCRRHLFSRVERFWLMCGVVQENVLSGVVAREDGMGT